MASDQEPMSEEEQAWYKRNARRVRLQEFAPRLAALGRNGRWGTCVECPCAGDGTVLPELCVNTDRYDHQLTMKVLADKWEDEPLFKSIHKDIVR